MEVQEDSSNVDQLKPQIVETQKIRRSCRIHQELERYRFLVTGENNLLAIDNEPTFYRGAISSPNFENAKLP